MKKKFTTSQKDALASLLHDGPVDNVAAIVRFGSAWRRTLLTLAERGLVRHFPTARASDGSRSGVWRITSGGRDEALDIEALELQREQKEKEAEAVRRWREGHEESPGELKLHVKVGTWPHQYLSAPQLRELPKVGDMFVLREPLSPFGPLASVRLTKIQPFGEDFLYIVERM